MSISHDYYGDDEPPLTKTGPDGGEHDKFTRSDGLNLLGLLVAAIVLATFYTGFVIFTDMLTQLQPEETDELRNEHSTDRTGSLRQGGLPDVPAD